MNHKEFTILAAISKSATFSSSSVDTTRDNIVSFGVLVSSASTLSVSVQLEGSFDNTNWASEGSPTVITANGLSAYTKADNPYPFVRLTFTFSTGSGIIKIDGHTKSY